MFRNQKILLPPYSPAEEKLNAASHACGIVFGVTVLILMLIKAQGTRNTILCALYGTALILLYSMSTIYHAFPKGEVKRTLRVFDHCIIFLLILGTYIPFTLIVLGGRTGWILFGIVVLFSVLGITLNMINLQKFRFAVMACYIGSGWTILFGVRPLLRALPQNGWLLLLARGIVYTIGAVLYGVGKKLPCIHAIFHLFVLAGSVLQFLSVYFYVL